MQEKIFMGKLDLLQSITYTSFIYYSHGIIIHNSTYDTNPEIPPGREAIKKARRDQKGWRPKKFPRPPHTPANILL